MLTNATVAGMGIKGWLGVGFGLFLVIALISGAGKDDGGTSKTPSAVAADSSQSASSDEPAKPALPTPGTWKRAKYELRDKFDDDVVELQKIGTSGIVVGLKADDNFTNGMIRTGMKLDAKDAFRQVYKDARYHPKKMLVQFHMKLVNKVTGKESDGIVAVYSLSRGIASQINWANQDVIDWDQFRTMLHPALS